MKKIIGCFEAKTNFNKIINNVISEIGRAHV